MSIKLPDKSKSSETMTQREQTWVDEQFVVGGCAFCPQFHVEGPNVAVREAQRIHREQVHPEIVVKKRKYGKGRVCKVGTCTNPAATAKGRYAGMCSSCRDSAKEANAENRSQKRGSTLGREAQARQRNSIVMTDARIAVAIRLVDAGCSFTQIGHLAAEKWGYKTRGACVQAINRAMSSIGKTGRSGPSRELLEISRSEAISLIEEAA